MKLTLKTADPYKTAKGDDYVRITVESDPVLTFTSGNFPQIQKLIAIKSWPLPAIQMLFGTEFKVGDVTNDLGIYQIQSFIPQRSIAADVARGTQKMQPWAGSRKTKKIYLSDGKPFFSQTIVEFQKDIDNNGRGPITLPNIDSVSLEDPAFAGLVSFLDPNAPRLTEAEFKAANIELHPDTLAKLNAPLKSVEPAASSAERAGAANTLVTP